MTSKETLLQLSSHKLIETRVARSGVSLAQRSCLAQ